MSFFKASWHLRVSFSVSRRGQSVAENTPFSMICRRAPSYKIFRYPTNPKTSKATHSVQACELFPEQHHQVRWPHLKTVHFQLTAVHRSCILFQAVSSTKPTKTGACFTMPAQAGCPCLEWMQKFASLAASLQSVMLLPSHTVILITTIVIIAAAIAVVMIVVPVAFVSTAAV